MSKLKKVIKWVALQAAEGYIKRVVVAYLIGMPAVYLMWFYELGRLLGVDLGTLVYDLKNDVGTAAYSRFRVEWADSRLLARAAVKPYLDVVRAVKSK